MSAYIRPLTFRGVTVKNNVFFAPVAGYSDVAYRRICKRYGAGLTFTEMVSAKGLIYENDRSCHLLAVAENEDVRAAQIFGGDPDFFRRVIEEGYLDAFDVIDINMGCPVGKIIKNGEGSSLMDDPERAAAIVSACRKATDKVISVKFRKGVREETAPEFAKALEGAGADFLTVHGRTAKQMYSGIADRDCIARTVRAVRIPVIGNGDVTDRASAEDMFGRTGCAGVMVARGALGNPAVFSEILGIPADFSPAKTLREQFEEMRRFGDRYAVLNIRKHVPFFLKGKPGASEFRGRINTCETPEEVLKVVAEFERL